MRSIIALSAAALVGLAVGQATPQSNYPYAIDPETVSSSTRATWCSNQRAQCPLICLQQPGVTSMTTLENECDDKALTFSCVCENNVSPNVTQYSQTLPFYICQQWGTNCVNDCHGDNICADKCRADHPCGAQSPYRGNTSIPTTSLASATASDGTSTTTTGSGDAEATVINTFAVNAAAGTFVPSTDMTMAALLSSVFLGFAILL